MVFVKGHKTNVGRKRPLSLRIKLSKERMGENNPNWKGENVKYGQLHTWVKKRMPRSNLCECCGKTSTLDLANKGVYNRNLDNWEWLCRRCHMLKDGRMKNLKQYSNKKLKK